MADVFKICGVTMFFGEAETTNGFIKLVAQRATAFCNLANLKRTGNVRRQYPGKTETQLVKNKLLEQTSVASDGSENPSQFDLAVCVRP
jgi:hypothetical protein